MIQTDVTYSQSNISSEEVEMLPVEEFEDVLALQAGVVSTGGEFSCGWKRSEISYMVDGITVTDPYNSGMAVEIENNAIQELNLLAEHLMQNMVRQCLVLSILLQRMVISPSILEVLVVIWGTILYPVTKSIILIHLSLYFLG